MAFFKKIIVTLFFAQLFWSCSKPKVNFSADKSVAAIGEVVSFKDSDEKSRKTIYSYDFGDGTQVTGINNPTHIYETSGTYTITQQVTKERSGKTALGEIIITITCAEADFEISSTSTPTIENPISFNNKTTGDGKGYAVSYLWQIEGPGYYNTFASKNLVWTPQNPGNYTITLYAKQGLSQTQKTQTVSVGGLNAAKLQEMLVGTWLVSSDALFEGNYGNTDCAGIPEKWKNAYLEVNFDSKGDITYAIIENPSAQSGNVIGGSAGNFGIYFLNEQWAKLPTAFGYNSAQGSAIGIYNLKSASASKIEFERVIKTDVSTNCKYTDTYSIVFTKK